MVDKLNRYFMIRNFAPWVKLAGLGNKYCPCDTCANNQANIIRWLYYTCRQENQ